MLSAFARPKVNLFLHVKGKREDGYHLLESLVVFPTGGDKISVREGLGLALTVAGPFAEHVGDTENNLVLRAARALQDKAKCELGADITLNKNLPVAAGIGGGSADAAATLHLLNQLWNLDFSSRQLKEIGMLLGADVPACLRSRPLMLSGIGEKLADVDRLPGFAILLINNRRPVVTADVFRKLDILSAPAPVFDFTSDNFDELIGALGNCRNDLQVAALEVVPEISRVLYALDNLVGCRLSRMSGSGGTCFGIFETAASAETAVRRIEADHPEWWVCSMPVSAETAC